jgi:integrase
MFGLCLKIVENHPSINIPIPKIEKNPKVGKFLEPDEAQSVINASDVHILRPIVIIALYYGLRRSEILEHVPIGYICVIIKYEYEKF